MAATDNFVQVRVTALVTRPLVRHTPSMGLKIRDVRKEYVNRGSYIVVEYMVAKCFKFCWRCCDRVIQLV